MKIIIMAGGGGTRLWPLSRNLRPKQFEPIVGDKSLLVQTIERLNGEFSIDDVIISTRKDLTASVLQQIPHFPKDHLFIEPQKRDTGPAMGLVCARLFRTIPDEPIAFLPSDHVIIDREQFCRCLRVAEKLIREKGKMVDIGAIPTFPSVNLGYTKIGEVIEEVEGISIRKFLGHTEKPPLRLAKEYVASGQYFWHASYYMWTPRKFLEAYEQTVPDLHAKFMTIVNAKTIEEEEDAFQQCEKISFDYAVTERLDPEQVLIIPALFDWSDVGQWSVVKREQEENPQDNVTRGDVVCLDSKNCLIYGSGGRTIAGVGLSNLIVIDTEDALLLCPMDRDQDVKKVVDALKDQGKDHVL